MGRSVAAALPLAIRHGIIETESAHPGRRPPTSEAERSSSPPARLEARPMATTADRDLLFGLLALQLGLIDQGQLVAAFQAWTRDSARSLAEHLIARGDLDSEQRAGLEAMVALHLKKHDGDVEKSLAAVPANRSTRASLVDLGEPEIEATLARVARAKNSRATEFDGEDDPDRTAGLSLGAATGDGQRFRILRPHARGGLGEVFVALDAELHREVALKQILEMHADDPMSRQRFVAEAEITGGLEHPGVVPVYGLGTYGGGRPYYAMRFIKGDSLKEAIEHFYCDPALNGDPGRRSLELRKLLRRFLDVTNAIDYAHSRGVIHRDVKPANIILGKHGETLVVDWGLAKAVGRADPSGGEQTIAPSSGGIIGDPTRQRAGNTGLHEPGAGAWRSRPAWPSVGCLLAGSHSLLHPYRQAAVRWGGHRGHLAGRGGGPLPAPLPA
jgi:eukaryotic-like serine/threonine-protein kinase